MTGLVIPGDFRNTICPDAAVVFVDPPYGLGKTYNGEKEHESFSYWVSMLFEWARNRCGWLCIIGPYPTMRTWLPQVPEPKQIVMWHRTFVLPGKKGLTGWLNSLSPVLVYNFGGDWYGPRINDRKYHDCIDAHSSMGDIQHLKKLGLHSRISDHPAITGTAFPSKLLSPLIKPGDVVVDPMAGIGSILVAAARLGAMVSGTEIRTTWASIANDWIAMEQESGR